MLKIRLLRTGRRNAPKYRLVLTDARVKRQGQYLEKLGHYDPAAKDEGGVNVNVERVRHWVEQGAQPTGAAASLLKTRGFNVTAFAAERKAKRKKTQKAAAAKKAS